MRNWPALRRSFLLRIQNVRIEFGYLKARCAVGAAGDRDAPAAERAALGRAARSELRGLRHERSLWASTLADLVEAAAAANEGRRDEALQRLASAERGFATLDMPLHGSIAARQRGVLIGGPNGEALVKQADAALDARTIRHPGRFAAMVAGGSFTAAG